MSIQPKVLMVELVMSADRLITSARAAQPISGQWPPVVVLGHICENDKLNWSQRIDAMVSARKLGQSPPHFMWFEPDGAHTENQYKNRDLEDVAAELMASRTSLLTTLRLVEPEDWESRATHEIFGDISLADLLIRLLAHDEEHRASLVLFE